MGLFDKFLNKKESNASYSPTSEHEAAFAILYSVVSADGNVTDSETNGLVRGLMRKRRYVGVEWSPVFKRVLDALNSLPPSEVIKNSAGLIPDDFRDTIFCLAVDAIMHDGDLDPDEFKIIEYLQPLLNIDSELANSVIRVLMIKNSEDIPLSESED